MTVEALYLVNPSASVNVFFARAAILSTDPQEMTESRAASDTGRIARGLAYAHVDAPRTDMYFVSALVWPVCFVRVVSGPMAGPSGPTNLVGRGEQQHEIQSGACAGSCDVAGFFLFRKWLFGRM